MKIVARQKTAYRLHCAGGHEFSVPRHSISVECPRCGRTDNTSAVIARSIGVPDSSEAV